MSGRDILMQAFEQEHSSTIDRIIAFLHSIDLPLIEQPIAAATLLPGVAIASGRLVIDRRQLVWPGDLLHEGGHIAVIPAALRSSLNDDLTDLATVSYAGEAEATAWAFAAVVAIGLDPTVLFHAGGYRGKSAGLAFTYRVGSYPGSGGLTAAGMALTRSEAASRGLKPYPHMIRWLRE